MSSLFYKYFLQKAGLDHIVALGPDEDPYKEEIPEEDLHFYQRKGAKRNRPLPDFIPKHDLKILKSVKRKAHRLDLAFNLCGLRVGWAAIIGLVPFIGDLFAMMLALQLVKKAQTVDGGLPATLQSRMMFNVACDFCLGLVPIVGDFINVLYKCNSRNFVLLEKHLVEKYDKERHKTAAAASEGAVHQKV